MNEVITELVDIADATREDRANNEDSNTSQVVIQHLPPLAEKLRDASQLLQSRHAGSDTEDETARRARKDATAKARR